MSKIKKYIYVTVGLIAFLLGCIGVMIPILPTTPFLLLASFCFVRGSEKFDRWFRSTSIYKNHLEEFITSRCMTKKQKITIVLFADTMLLFPIVLLDNMHIKLFLISIASYKTYYFIFKIKTIDKTEIKRS